MIFCAAGVGMGGNASGVPYDTFKAAMTGKPLAFSTVTIPTPFSIRMLHTSAGLYAGVSAGIAVLAVNCPELALGRLAIRPNVPDFFIQHV